MRAGVIEKPLRNTSDHSEGEDNSDYEDVPETTVGASGPNFQTASRDLLVFTPSLEMGETCSACLFLSKTKVNDCLRRVSALTKECVEDEMPSGECSRNGRRARLPEDPLERVSESSRVADMSEQA